MTRRARIVATLGPSTAGQDRIRELVLAGMNVARLNMSHGARAEHEASLADVRAVSEELRRPVGALVDLQGPKIRLATFADGPQLLQRGAQFTITTRDVPGSAAECGTTFAGLPRNVRPGDAVLIDDGNVALRAVDVTDTDVVTRVEVAGRVSDHKGINLPGVAVDVPALSDKDEDDLAWALDAGADMIAMSFVRSADDVRRVHEFMDEHGGRIPVISKIEKPQAVDHLAEIIEESEGIMVARGDLGVELPLEQVPAVQKRAVELARRLARPVIVATQMLESMIHASRPTRAEASDCANAVLDGADALMLSGETSVGEHPVEAVRIMARIIEETERHGLHRIPPLGTKPHTQSGAVTRAAASVAEFLEAKYVCVFTSTGNSARRMGRLRNPIPMLVFTYDEATRRRMSVMWGCESVLVPFLQTTDEIVLSVDTYLLESGLASQGEVVVVVAGTPPGMPGSTNDLRVLRVGDSVRAAAPGYRKAAAQLMRRAVEERRGDPGPLGSTTVD